MKKTTLTVRVMAFLKGGDEAKLVRFETRLQKYFKSQVDILEKEKEILNDKLSDAKEELNDYIPNIDIDKISKADGMDEYIKSYVGGLDEKQQTIDDLEETLNELDGEIARLNQLQELIYSEEK